MDFFARQDQARKQTSLLVIYFTAAVVLIVVALNLLALSLVHSGASAAPAVASQDGGNQPAQYSVPVKPSFWQPEIIVFVTVITLLVIGAGSLFKIAQLSGGGRSVAEMMRAIAIPPSPVDPKQKMLRNVVEEMSIASGVPVPGIYVLPREPGLNAFAAGFTPKDAVICVTQGSLDRLTREELQSVIAHEFSHIYNGDMRLDLHLVGTLHGILLLGLIGYGLIRVGGAVTEDNEKGAAVGIAILVVGCIVAVIGFIGLFFGRLIQAAVCRQREFLADAAATQFTRNPDALANALKKLGASGSTSRIGNHSAEQIAHMFFASSMGIEWGLFATHPPLAKRIKAIDPSWDGQFVSSESPGRVERNSVAPDALTLPRIGIPVAAAAIVGSLGSPMPRHIAWASDFLTSIPPTIDQAAREPFTARALVFALLLSDDQPIRQKQLTAVRDQANQITAEAVVKLIEPVGQLGARARRVLLDLSIPALRMLSDPQADQFRKVVKCLVEADDQLSIFEFMLYKILAKNLPAQGAATSQPQMAYFAVKPVMADLQILLSALAAADAKAPAAVDLSFQAGTARLNDVGPLTLQRPVGLDAVDAALDRLVLATPAVKRRVIDACAYCVAADGLVQTEEGELLRALTTALDCPLPPLLGERFAPLPQGVHAGAT
jgi:Zn-dependent protease with chaperone function